MHAFQHHPFSEAYHSSIPFVRNETAQSHLFRVLDFLHPELWDDPQPAAIAREVIITLLCCAARLYEDGVYIKEAVDLIKNEETRAILSLGIQSQLSEVTYQQRRDIIQPNTSEATNAENCPQHAIHFSNVLQSIAHRLNTVAMIIKNVSALCSKHIAALQNGFDAPRIDEPFMFRNFIILSKSFSICENASLIALLPDVFQ